MTTSRAGLLQYLSLRGVKQDSPITVIEDEAAEYYWRARRCELSVEQPNVDHVSEIATWCRAAGARFAKGWAQ